MANKRTQGGGAQRKAKAPSPAAAPGAPTTVLGRVLQYAEKVYGLCARLRAVRDQREKPRIPARRAALSYVVLLLARLGSLNERFGIGEQPGGLRDRQPFGDGDLQSLRNLGRLRRAVRSFLQDVEQFERR